MLPAWYQRLRRTRTIDYYEKEIVDTIIYDNVGVEDIAAMLDMEAPGYIHDEGIWMRWSGPSLSEFNKHMAVKMFDLYGHNKKGVRASLKFLAATVKGDPKWSSRLLTD